MACRAKLRRIKACCPASVTLMCSGCSVVGVSREGKNECLTSTLLLGYTTFRSVGTLVRIKAPGMFRAYLALFAVTRGIPEQPAVRLDSHSRINTRLLLARPLGAKVLRLPLPHPSNLAQ